jgi:anti-sigma B factor antagonist
MDISLNTTQEENMSLTVTEKQSGAGVTILEVKGFIDTSTSGVLEDSIKKVHEAKKTRLVLDLAGSEFISSAGWGAMVAYLKKLRTAGGDLKLAGMVEKVDKVFKLMEFDSLIDAFATVEEAVKSYQA